MTFERQIIALENESLALAARLHDIPVIDLAMPLAQILEQCQRYDIDLILMSCYRERLPDALICFPGYGCFNMHPSLLPGYRGPEPIFWQLQQGADLGVSWHRVVPEFDAGDIAAQKRVYLDDALDYHEICQLLAEAGSDILVKLLQNILKKNIKYIKQDIEYKSYYSYPSQDDFILLPTCTAQQLYNFMHGTAIFSLPYLYQSGDSCFLLETAVDYDNNKQLSSAMIEGGNLHIPCKQGVFIATYTAKL